MTRLVFVNLIGTLLISNLKYQIACVTNGVGIYFVELGQRKVCFHWQQGVVLVQIRSRPFTWNIHPNADGD